MDSTLTLDTKFQSGAWTLYFHAQGESKWGIDTFIKVGTMTSWREFWAIMNTLKPDNLSHGMFFLMRDPILPLWENHQNIRGGGYSFRIIKENAGEAFITYAIATMILKTQKDPTNCINGISISPKKKFNVIKIWNTDCKRYKTPSDINILLPDIRHEGDIIYTPFVQKKM